MMQESEHVDKDDNIIRSSEIGDFKIEQLRYGKNKYRPQFHIMFPKKEEDRRYSLEDLYNLHELLEITIDDLFKDRKRK